MLTILSPAQGAFLSDPAGVRSGDCLSVRVLCNAPAVVNGVPAVQEADGWVCCVPLTPGENRLVAQGGGETAEASVQYVPALTDRYSFSVDDVIWSLADLTRNPEKYPSVFDQPFFALFKRLHEKYGLTVRFNLFRRLDNEFGLSLFGPFTLQDMTDRYREEFRQNADWMRFAYHDEIEHGGLMPAEEMLPSVDSVYEEVRRFAGEEALEDVLTTIHCVRIDHAAVKPLCERGMRCLMGLKRLENRISYGYSEEFCDVVHEYGFARDAETDMIYGELAIVLNKFLPEEVPAELERVAASHPRHRFMELMIHEQYFYPGYARYMADFEDRIVAGIEWCRARGMQPVFTSEALGVAKNIGVKG